jgi:predicted permease
MRLEHWIYAAPLRLKSLFRRRQVEQDLDDELQYHLDRKIEEHVAGGLTLQQARRAALRAMDGLTQRKEECRDTRRVNFIETTFQDIRYSLRLLAKSPGFTLVAILTLSLAIGANAVVFGALNALVLRSLNVPRAQSLYAIQRNQDTGTFQSYPDYIDLRDRNRSFEALTAFAVGQAGLDTGQNPTTAWVFQASGNYFDVLGIRPYLGRFFNASDERGPNSAPYVVLTYAYWHAHFQDDRGVIGRAVRINKHPYTIIGVAPPDFHGTILFFGPDIFVPIVNQEQIQGVSTMGVDLMHTRASRWIFMAMGHLKTGVTQAQAIADLNSVGAYLERTYPKEDGQMTFKLVQPRLAGDFLGRPARAFMAGLSLMAALILLAACANLGSLFAARAADRSREVALRLALGAGRVRILRQIFTESTLIALAGGAIGLWLSVLLLARLSVWQPFARFPIVIPVNPDAKVYGVALVLALASGVLFSLVPVRQTLRTDPYQIVKAGSTGFWGRRLTVRDLLLVVQISICAVLVASSLVAVRGLARSLHANFGFEPRNALLINTDLNMAGYRGESVPEMQRHMVDAVAAIPGVESAALVDQPPLTMGGTTTLVFSDQTADLRPATAAAQVYILSVSPDYFRASGTTLLAGRSFSWHDDQNAPPTAVINRTFANKVFGSVTGAIGGYFKRRSGKRFQVVGVVEDGKYQSLTEDVQAAMFMPIVQMPASATWTVVRSRRDPQQLAIAVRNTLRNLDPGLPSFIQTWNQAMELILFPSRVATVALGVLGLMGAMLSVTGIFGMAAYAVSKRLRELGIRMALGARRQEVIGAALGRAFKLLALGSMAGLLLGVLATRVLAYIVYQASPRDPLVLGGAILAMLLLGVMATWIPAHRALSLDPSRLLREE